MKHFSQEDVEHLKKKEQQGGGCLSDLVSTLAVFGLIVMVVAAILSFAGTHQPGVAVAVDATVIYGPTELVLVNTPTLRPTATPAIVAIEVAATAVSPATIAPTTAPTYTPLPTYTAVPTQTPVATYTPPPTQTPAATFTPFPTWTPAPTAVPIPVPDFSHLVSDYSATRTTLTRLTWLAAGLIGVALVVMAYSLRPSDRDLKRLQRLIEMHLLAGLKTPAPVQALPAPVRTTPLAEYRRNRVAPVQTPVTPVTPVQNTGAAPPETIMVSVQPNGAGDDMATMRAICELWNEITERGERPSLNRVCVEYFGSKNSDRLALIRRAVRWGREQEVVVTAVSETAVSGGAA